MDKLPQRGTFMIGVRAGTVTLFVLLVTAALAIFASVMMHHAHYAQRAAADMLAYQQRVSAAESVLRYAIAWCNLNRGIFSPEDEGSVQLQWQLKFDGIRLAPKKTVSAIATITALDKNSWRAVAEIQGASGAASRASCVLSGGGGDIDTPLFCREWQVT